MRYARVFVGAIVAASAACAAPSAIGSRGAEASGEAKALVAPASSADGGWNLSLTTDSVRPVATASPGASAVVEPSVPGKSEGTCAAAPTSPGHPLALALTRDLKVPFAAYACVFRSSTDPDAAVPGFRVRALAAAPPFAPAKGYGERRWAFLERYASELGLAAPRQQLVVLSDDPMMESVMFMAGMSRLQQRVPATGIGSGGFVELELGAGAAPLLTAIDVAILEHPERLARGARVSRRAAQEAALKAARADGAVPARIAKLPSLALRTTASGTALVYEVTIAQVVLSVGGFSAGPTWLVRVDAATGKVASLHHD